MNKKFILALVMVGASLIYVRFQIVGMEEGSGPFNPKAVAEMRRREREERERRYAVPSAPVENQAAGGKE